jgi:AcrR family transcriptional regulator
MTMHRLSNTARTQARSASKDGSTPPLTPLARSLRDSKTRATPLDAFTLATQKWLRGERLDIGQLAAELGVNPATVFRWVGTREQLYGQVLSEAYARQREHILKTTPGSGLARVVRIVRRNLNALLEAPALRKFVEQDPEFAIRVLTSKSSSVQERTIALERAFLEEVVRTTKVKPVLDLDTLAYIVVRIGEAFLYADVISDRKPEIEKAVATIHALVSGGGRGVAARRPTRRVRRSQT